jgi:N-acetylglutamate synthase-like GNAT family acetyltransferase
LVFAKIMFNLRPATEDDIKTIRQLVRIGQINPTGLKWHRFVVAETPGGQVIGCGQIKSHSDGSDELASIVVHPDWRGQGVARAIIERLLAAHSGDLYLMCRAKMGPMYEKFNFHPLEVNEMPRYFRRIMRMLGFLDRVRNDEEGVLIMKRSGDS